MEDSKRSELWRISAFQREQDAVERSSGDGRPALLPTTLLADLRQLRRNAEEGDALETLAACVRHREPALIYLEYGSHVWPLTLFPRQTLYHSPIDVTGFATSATLGRLKVISAEPPVVQAPDHLLQQRDETEQYRPLGALLWAIALHGPRTTLLNEISGLAAYRLVAGGVSNLPSSMGALGAAVTRLRLETASVEEIASWPGMSLARASRLLNGLYLNGGLMISRSHPAAMRRPVKAPAKPSTASKGAAAKSGGWRGLFGLKR